MHVTECSASPSITLTCLTWVVSPGKGFWEGHGVCPWFATSSLRWRNTSPVSEAPPTTRHDGVVTSLLFLSFPISSTFLCSFIFTRGLWMSGAIPRLIFDPLDSHTSHIYLESTFLIFLYFIVRRFRGFFGHVPTVTTLSLTKLTETKCECVCKCMFVRAWKYRAQTAG